LNGNGVRTHVRTPAMRARAVASKYGGGYFTGAGATEAAGG